MYEWKRCFFDIKPKRLWKTRQRGKQYDIGTKVQVGQIESYAKKSNRGQQKVHIWSTKSQHFVNKKSKLSQKFNFSQIFKKWRFITFSLFKKTIQRLVNKSPTFGHQKNRKFSKKNMANSQLVSKNVWKALQKQKPKDKTFCRALLNSEEDTKRKATVFILVNIEATKVGKNQRLVNKYAAFGQQKTIFGQQKSKFFLTSSQSVQKSTAVQ